jgi:5-formyltetrahydrofolate cyclo-ligase
VWGTLVRQGLARPPLPVHGRIPAFASAERAAQRLFEEPEWRNARTLKVNPDSAQLAVRVEALRRGIVLYVPTPKLAGSFLCLDPGLIPPAKFAEAATHRTMARWAQSVPLHALRQPDAIVAGSVAVTTAGKRCGKGAGYSDMEFALLLELGFEARPVATTVHDVQVLGDFPVFSNDQPLSVICTPSQTLRIESTQSVPQGMQWERLSHADLQAMPVLAELQRLQIPPPLEP